MAARVKRVEQKKESISTGRVAKQSKSRAGCQRCKTKRLKCDETKPGCEQCSKRGIVCPGYQIEFKSFTKYAAFDEGKLPTTFWPTSSHATISSSPGNASDKSVHSERSSASVSSNHPTWDAALSAGHSDRRSGSPIGTESDSSPDARRTALSGLGDEVESPAIAHPQAEHVAVDGATNAVSDIESIDMAPDLSFVGLMPQFDMQLWGTEFQMVPAIPKRIMDLPTTLLDYWFASICPMWSVFDSATNQNRMIASGVWAHSEAAYYTLQAMSASYLGDNLPLMRRQLPGLTARACDAINREIISLSSSTTTSESLPSGLLFAIFAMGTSLHWNDPTKLSKWYIAQARAILRRFEASGVDLDLSSQKHASYFRHALVWWTMLHDVVGDSLEDGNETSSRERERASVTAKVHSSSTLGQNLAGPQPVLSQELILHPWTGTSTGIVEQFSLAVRLCHRHVERHKQHAMPTVDGLRAALQDIELAQNLERTLLDTDFVSLHARRSFNGGYLAETGDVLTPIEHLFDTAEATRLAALLHLYETFTDLKIENAIADDLSSLGSATQESPPIKKRHQALSKLALHLLQILRRIPIESRSRSCQILLYMTGAIGLRFDETDPAADQIPPLFPMDAIAVAPPFSIPNSQQPGLDFSLFGQNNALELSEHMLEIAEGRRFITERLNALQGVLPPKPILVALKLVKTIWNEYDEGRPETHWISVMNSSGLRTLFG